MYDVCNFALFTWYKNCSKKLKNHENRQKYDEAVQQREKERPEKYLEENDIRSYPYQMVESLIEGFLDSFDEKWQQRWFIFTFHQLVTS